MNALDEIAEALHAARGPPRPRPILNSAAHLAGGALHFLLGYSLGHTIDRRGLATAAFFGLTFAAGTLTREFPINKATSATGTGTNP